MLDIAQNNAHWKNQWLPLNWFPVQFCFLKRNYSYEAKISIHFTDICSKLSLGILFKFDIGFFHVVVWLVWLMLHNFVSALACFIIFTSLPFDLGRYTQQATLSQIEQWNTKKRCGICSKLTMKTSERHQCFLMFSCQWGHFELWTDVTHCSRVSIASLEQVNIRRVYSFILLAFLLQSKFRFSNPLTPGVKKKSFILKQIWI